MLLQYIIRNLPLCEEIPTQGLQTGILLIYLSSLIIKTAVVYEVLDRELFERLNAIQDLLTAVAMYTSVLQTATFHLNTTGQSRSVKFLVSLSLKLIHLALAGSTYAYYLGITFFSNDLAWLGFKNAWRFWSKLYVGLTIFTLISIFLPVAVLIYRVVIRTNHISKEQELENGGRGKGCKDCPVKAVPLDCAQVLQLILF
jgi:hypothetical protein